MVIAIALIVFVSIIALFVRSRRISRIEFIQQHLGSASKTRFAGFQWEGYSPLPTEFLIFEEVQKIRSIGYEPIWKDYRYLLMDPAGGGEIDPFLWKGNWPRWLKDQIKGDDVTRLFRPWAGTDDVLFGNIVEGAYGDGYNDSLYSLKLLGVHQITMKGNRFIIAKKSSGNDVRIDFDQIRLRDAAIKYGFWFTSEPVLHDYGFIMQRKGQRIYLPVSIDTGERFEIPARRIVIPRAIEALNRSVKEGIRYYGSREMIPEPLEPGPEVSAKRFLDLCDVRINWDEATQQYEIVK